MGGLFHALTVGARTLSQLETAIRVTGSNIANVNTPGYARRRVIFQAVEPDILQFGTMGRGAEIQRIESVRDRLLERRILLELQSKGRFTGQQFALQEIETILYGRGEQSLTNQLGRFFNSFSELAGDPASLELRQATLSEGRSVASAIGAVQERLLFLQRDNTQQAQDLVAEINDLAVQIAELDNRIVGLNNVGFDGASLEDRRQKLLNRLAELVDITVDQDSSGYLIVSTTGGRMLVGAGKSFSLTLQGSGGSLSVTYPTLGVDITSEIQGGRLGGLLELDGQILPGYLDALNTLATELADQVNALHQTGQGLDGSSGLDFFSFSSSNPAGSLAVALSDPRSVAAGASGSGPGDNTVADQIAALRDQTFSNLDNNTFSGFFSQLVFEAGLGARQLRESLANTETILSQLENQREAVSGVSLDEEAVQLIQFQRSYQANARFMRAVDEMMQETMNLIR